MSGGGIGVEFSLKNLPKMLPGLILCAIFGWMALQWDTTMGKWNTNFKEAEKVLKAVNEGKSPADFAEYKKKHEDGFAKKTEEFKVAEEAYKAAKAGGDKAAKAPKKPSKPTVLAEADFNQVAQTKAIPGTLSFGNLMISFQLTYVAMLLLVGMLIRNTVGLPDVFKAGTVAARPLIKPGIIILGAYYMWSDVLKVGFFGLALVVAFVMGTQVLISYWARRAKVAGKRGKFKQADHGTGCAEPGGRDRPAQLPGRMRPPGAHRSGCGMRTRHPLPDSIRRTSRIGLVSAQEREA